jgi:putative salt-induced outer membrane protein YdiY
MKEVDLGPIGDRSGASVTKALMEAGIVPAQKINTDTHVVAAKEISPGVTHMFAQVDDSAVDAEVIAAAETTVATKRLNQIRSREELMLEALAEELALDSDSLIERYQDKVAVDIAVEDFDTRPSTL